MKLTHPTFNQQTYGVDWWNKAEAVPGYDIPGYKFAKGAYPFQHTSCPSISSLNGDTNNCQFKCNNDKDCPLLQYCCPTGCGRICVPPQILPEDDCGCSVSFLQEDDYDYYVDYDVEYDYVDKKIQNFVWESVSESFVPDMEPYIIVGPFDYAYLGPMDSQCSLKRSIEYNLFTGTKYTVFKKPKRMLFIISENPALFDDVSLAPLAALFTTVCAVAVGNVTINESLKEQLTVVSGKPCVWNVSSYSNLKDVLPSVKSVINDGSCLCGGETVPSSPCLGAGEACSKDSQCDQPTHICDKGICSLLKCTEPDTFNLFPEYHDYYTFYDYNPSSLGAWGSEYNYDYGYYHDYDYFYDAILTPPQNSRGFLKQDNEVKEQSRNTPVNSSYSNMNINYSKYAKEAVARTSYLTEMLSVCCPWNYLQCSGVPTLCVQDIDVCDGIADCFNGEDETTEACAKRVCGDGWFKCNSGSCISKMRVCDGYNDCPDGTDEICLKQSDCPSNRQSFCSSGECISHLNICDGYFNCKNGEDELHCRCKGFRCKSGQCIGSNSVCDGYNNCLDRSDEQCGGSGRTCPSSRPFKCDNGTCLYESKKCDGRKSCKDGSDEDPKLCSPESCFYCDSGKCVSNTTICNGISDCADGADEANCRDFTCDKNKFHCDSGECLPDSVWCNKREECLDGSDESSCNAAACPDSRPFFCSSGECIDYTQICDGKYDCIDRSDESKCQSLICPEARQYQCSSGQCKKTEIGYCDGLSDCLDNNDEQICQVVECPDDEKKCKSGDCFNRYQVCNGRRDCEDGTDEEDCQGTPCPYGSDIHCNSGECIYDNLWCNGYPDCSDRSDEECQNYDCSKIDKFKCESGKCSDNDACDGTIGCQDGSDEKNCGDKVKCSYQEKKCTSGECKYKYVFCDGYSNCFDGSDENNCQSFTCPVYRPFHCKSGECRKAFEQCNGFTSCSDGSDEANCKSYTCPPFRPFACPSGICITTYQLCNGVDDCGDESDEKNCNSIKCAENDFKCKKGNCIPLRYICDDEDDCDEGEDELNCKNYQRPCGKQFKCVADDTCIHYYTVCDGFDDCSDGADEKNC